MSSSSYLASIIFSVLLIIFGVIIIMNPAGTMTAFALIISIVMIITGLTNIFLFMSLRDFKGSIYYLIEGGISIILGIMLLSSQSALENLLPLLVGFWIALKSVTAVVTAIEWKKRSYPAWKSLMTGGIIGILLALLIAAVPKIVSVYISLVLGIAMIIVGVVIILFVINLRRISSIDTKKGLFKSPFFYYKK